MAQDRYIWRALGVAYIQQRTSFGWYDDDDDDIFPRQDLQHYFNAFIANIELQYIYSTPSDINLFSKIDLICPSDTLLLRPVIS